MSVAFEDERRQRPVVRLALDTPDSQCREQIQEQPAGVFPERTDDEELEHHAPGRDVLAAFHRAIADRDAVERQQVGISPAALVTGVIPDLEAGLGEELRTE